MEQLVQKVIIPSVGIMAENDGFEVVNKTLQLILCLLDDPSAVSEISVKWDPVFDLRNSR